MWKKCSQLRDSIFSFYFFRSLFPAAAIFFDVTYWKHFRVSGAIIFLMRNLQEGFAGLRSCPTFLWIFPGAVPGMTFGNA